jgi:hypothetical protein
MEEGNEWARREAVVPAARRPWAVISTELAMLSLPLLKTSKHSFQKREKGTQRCRVPGQGLNVDPSLRIRADSEMVQSRCSQPTEELPAKVHTPLPHWGSWHISSGDSVTGIGAFQAETRSLAIPRGYSMGCEGLFPTGGSSP